MTAYFNFTKTELERLVAKEKRYAVADTKIPGLRLMVYPSGKKTFILVRKIKGRSEKIKVGRFTDLTIEQARKQALKFNSMIALGGNPAQERKEERSEITFKKLYEIYYSEYALLHTKRPEANKKMMEFHILPVLGNYKLREVTSDKVRKLHVSLGTNSGKGSANRVMSVVNAVFNFGIKNGYHKYANPCYGLVKFKEHSRERFLNKDELTAFFSALSYESLLYQDYFSLLLYTGARKSNVLSMKWADISLELKRWRLPETDTKNGEVNIIYLSDSSLEILARRKVENDKIQQPSIFVFPSESVLGHLIDPKKAFQRIKDRMKVQDIRMHDLRRTLASYMAISGASLPIIGKALNHRSQVSTAIYARLDKDPVLEAINLATEIMFNKSEHSAITH